MKTANSNIDREQIILKITKKSDIGFLEYHILGLLSFGLNLGQDSLTITNKKIEYIIKSNLVKSVFFNDFSTLKFNAIKDTISCINLDNKEEFINLKKIRLSYQEIQEIKTTLEKNI